jgi:hypothetical protein
MDAIAAFLSVWALPSIALAVGAQREVIAADAGVLRVKGRKC